MFYFINSDIRDFEEILSELTETFFTGTKPLQTEANEAIFLQMIGFYKRNKASAQPCEPFDTRRRSISPSGRLVIRDNVTGEAIEPEFEKSIEIVECPSRGEHGSLWVRSGIPIKSANGRQYNPETELRSADAGD